MPRTVLEVAERNLVNVFLRQLGDELTRIGDGSYHFLITGLLENVMHPPIWVTNLTVS